MLRMVDGFTAQAQVTPDAVAAVCGSHRVSYRELDTAVGWLAVHLRDRGVGIGDLVAVHLPRSVEMLAAVLAVGRAGAAYLPLDPAYPAARRATVLADAAPRLVLTTSARLAELDPALPAMSLDRLPDPKTGPPEGGQPEARQPEALPSPDPDTLAYVIYTSGSTGRPKGVAVPHAALANFLTAMRDALGSGPDDVWLNLTTLSFDISTLELYLPLLLGGRTVIVPEELVRDGAALVRLIRAERVTHVQATPSGWRILLDGGFGAPPGRVVALAGGEALPLPLARQLRALTRRLFNVYGPTETTVWSTLAELPERIDEVTIGTPIANTDTYLLDDRLRLVPDGTPGELFIGGAGVADGYLNRPELTAQRFLPDPFRPGPHGFGRMYRTGDLCRRRPDGHLVYLSRVDDQIKLRGHRIELGEVESALLACPGVRGAAVALRGGDAPRLVGYLVGDGDPSPHRLREQLAAILPAVMVPTTWMRLDTLPLTPNGKLDRAALPDPPDHHHPQRDDAAGAGAGDPTTEQIRAIWQEALHLPHVDLADDLFDIGGDSLTVARIIARVNQRLGVELPLETFYEAPTLIDVAAAVDRIARAPGDLAGMASTGGES